MEPMIKWVSNDQAQNLGALKKNRSHRFIVDFIVKARGEPSHYRIEFDVPLREVKQKEFTWFIWRKKKTWPLGGGVGRKRWSLSLPIMIALGTSHMSSKLYISKFRQAWTLLNWLGFNHPDPFKRRIIIAFPKRRLLWIVIPMQPENQQARRGHRACFSEFPACLVTSPPMRMSPDL